jgi:DNA-directed RNA polymerase subunit M/transcription elongation factor TFIIS
MKISLKEHFLNMAREYGHNIQENGTCSKCGNMLYINGDTKKEYPCPWCHIKEEEKYEKMKIARISKNISFGKQKENWEKEQYLKKTEGIQ